MNTIITFQRFDPEWDDYVDLDLTSKIENKDKLNAIVIPTTVSLAVLTPSTKAPESEVSLHGLCRLVTWFTCA